MNQGLSRPGTGDGPTGVLQHRRGVVDHDNGAGRVSQTGGDHVAEPGSVYSGVSVRAQDKKSGTGCSVEQHRNRPTVLTGLPDLGGFGRLGERSLDFVLQHADGSAVKLLGRSEYDIGDGVR